MAYFLFLVTTAFGYSQNWNTNFDEVKLNVKGGKFQDASVFYNDLKEIDKEDLKHWLEKSRKIQWDYKNIVKRKGKLERIL